MRRRLVSLLLLIAAIVPLQSYGQPEPLSESSCVSCHANSGLWEPERRDLYVDYAEISSDVHWKAGVACHDCHGGNPNEYEFQASHDVGNGFQKAPTPAEVPVRCGKCHSDEQYMRRFSDGPWVDYVDRFRQSVHGTHLVQTGGDRAATCTGCHSVHNMLPADEPQSPLHATQLAQTCGRCHQEQLVDLRRGVHETAGVTDSRSAGSLLNCLECHRGDVHEMVPAKDPRSPVVQDGQVLACGGCHERDLKTYQLSPHAVRPSGSDAALAAVCSDCHGAHAIYRAADKRSSLHAAHAGETCGRCHEGIPSQVAASVHGEGNGGPEIADSRRREPSCVDCHRAHEHFDRDSPLAPLHRTSRCGNCHAEFAQSHRIRTHSRLTEVGYVAAAGCADCHGAHDILAVAQPKSHLAAGNRVQTCRSCHPRAVSNFADFDPHASYKDVKRNPLLHDAHEGLSMLIFGVFGLFVVHSGPWFTRSFVPTLAHGRHKRLVKQERAIVRFGLILRVSYLILLVCFVGLLVTALPLTYSDADWAERLATSLGGFVLTRLWHIAFAVIVLVVSAAQVVLGIWRVREARKRSAAWKTIVFGPDSPVPNRRDVRDFLGMVRWFFGRGEKPTFERWSYWEKLDFWAFALTVLVIGVSGLMLWWPNFFAVILPGSVLNLAKMVHSEIAVLAAGLVFVIHLFNMHLRPEKFPIDTSVFTGLVSEEHIRVARPDYPERMEREGRLDVVERIAPSEKYLRLIGWAGFLTLIGALLVLVWVFFVSLNK